MTDGNIDRRDFIRKSFIACCMTNMPVAGYGLAKKSKQEKAGPEVNPVELAASCGIYCGACDIRAFFPLAFSYSLAF